MAKITAIVLAAGASKRHKNGPKLLRELDGAPLIRRTLELVSSCGFEECFAVIRANDADLRKHAEEFGFVIIENADADQGIGSSIACGVSYIGDADAVAIFLGDMPLIRPQTVEELKILFEKRVAPVVRPAIDGALGHPVIISQSYFGALMGLRGEGGAATIFKKNDVALCATDDEGVIRDFDVEEDFLN